MSSRSARKQIALFSGSVIPRAVKVLGEKWENMAFLKK